MSSQASATLCRTFLALVVYLLIASIPLARSQDVGAVTYLNQGWTEKQRQQFYTTSQGSQLMPLRWFLSLERPGSEEIFVSDGLARFGYLPNPKSPENPDALPVGFTEDTNGGTWLGLTCAACHTSQIEYGGAQIRIDGGPANADLYAFLAELSDSLSATNNDSAKFTRFAQRVGAIDSKHETDLRNELTRFTAYFSTFLKASTPNTPWGPARADAFGMIFNRLAAIDLSDKPFWAWFQPIESNSQVPNAPVSYPFLWGTSRLDLVQWNAIADNRDPYHRLGRNIGEALGVFARINLRKPTVVLLGYPSTVNAANQQFIEEQLISSLRSPAWPQPIFGGFDPDKVAKGAAIYNRYCLDCHKLVSSRENTPVKVTPVPVAAVGTDPSMTVTVACRMAATGALAGTRQPPLIGRPLSETDFAINLVTNIVAGVEEASLASSGVHQRVSANSSTSKTQAGSVGSEHRFVPFQVSSTAQGNCTPDRELYKAGPLGGIWATAPYLHNGSVPNLYQLLLPVAERVTKFKVGSRQFDPKNVGFDYALGSFELDTSLPGNGNSGHEYGTTITEEERWQLIEFLKTL